jgi:hypothetical protein
VVLIRLFHSHSQWLNLWPMLWCLWQGECGENEVWEEEIYSLFDWQPRVVELGGGFSYGQLEGTSKRKRQVSITGRLFEG